MNKDLSATKEFVFKPGIYKLVVICSIMVGESDPQNVHGKIVICNEKEVEQSCTIDFQILHPISMHSSALYMWDSEGDQILEFVEKPPASAGGVVGTMFGGSKYPAKVLQILQSNVLRLTVLHGRFYYLNAQFLHLNEIAEFSISWKFEFQCLGINDLIALSELMSI